MNTFKELISSWGPKQLSEDMDVHIWRVDKWRYNGIPVKQWPRLLVKAKRRKIKINEKDLLKMVENLE